MVLTNICQDQDIMHRIDDNLPLLRLMLHIEVIIQNGNGLFNDLDVVIPFCRKIVQERCSKLSVSAIEYRLNILRSVLLNQIIVLFDLCPVTLGSCSTGVCEILFDKRGVIDLNCTLHHHPFGLFDGVFCTAVLTDKHAVCFDEILTAAHFTNQCFHGVPSF